MSGVRVYLALRAMGKLPYDDRQALRHFVQATYCGRTAPVFDAARVGRAWDQLGDFERAVFIDYVRSYFEA